MGRSVPRQALTPVGADQICPWLAQVGALIKRLYRTFLQPGGKWVQSLSAVKPSKSFPYLRLGQESSVADILSAVNSHDSPRLIHNDGPTMLREAVECDGSLKGVPT